jgi:FtsP/CotA-like multicopper oxidase with cupredoxin domain
MNRRALLLSVAAVGGLAGAAWLAGRNATLGQMPGMAMPGGDKSGMSGMDMSGGSSAPLERIRTLPAGAPLAQIARLENTSNEPGFFAAALEAGPARHEFTPGLTTEILAYNGAVPGAMIEVFEGDRIRIDFRNRIPGQPSTIHWHGLDIPADQDGNPADPVASGSDRTYEFTVPTGSAGSYWYHPHPHGLTAEQVYRGLAAPFIVRSENDPLSANLGDTVLFISSVSLNADGAISGNTDADRFNGREGDHVLVNGAKQPVLTAPPGASRRFRIYNATNGRFLRLAVEGHQMTQVGTDGGLLESPVRGLTELLLAPAERAEIVIDFQGREGRFALNGMAYERGWMGGGKPAGETLRLMTFELSGAAVSPVAIPERLRAIKPLGEPKTVKKIAFSESMGMTNGAMTMGFLIDGRSFDMARVDLKSTAGDVELWEIANTTDMDHPFHIHGTQFQIVEREFKGNMTAAPFRAWKDTVNVTSKETVRILVRHTMPGTRMYHCHILEHEDNGMMGQLEVV